MKELNYNLKLNPLTPEEQSSRASNAKWNEERRQESLKHNNCNYLKPPSYGTGGMKCHICGNTIVNYPDKDGKESWCPLCKHEFVWPKPTEIPVLIAKCKYCGADIMSNQASCIVIDKQNNASYRFCNRWCAGDFYHEG